ncbi:MAG: Rieske 2Fe-2S domain-containing protein [Sneathiellaceae bacterium]
MLKPEDNDILTQTDRGTPMGDMMRRFWIPFMTAKEVPEADGAPVRVTLLGEQLLAFRDTDGRVGLIDEFCPHRRSSLFFGRNEECGIRCVYHGWKFDVNGTCVEVPSEPADSTLARKVRLTAYPVREAGGVLWAYMGPAGQEGALPNIEWLTLPATHVYVSRWQQESNYFQALEGEVDSSHVSFLHRVLDARDAPKGSLSGAYFRNDTAPKWTIDPNPQGLTLAARRTVEDGAGYWRMNQFMLPFYTMIAPEPGGFITNRMWVPMDDTHCWVICATYRPDKALTEDDLEKFTTGKFAHRRVLPGTTIPMERKENDYGLDRKAQKTVSYTGIPGVRAQDAMVTETAGPIADRSKEHLGTSDTAIIAARKVMIEAAKGFRDGKVPEAAKGGDLYAVRSWSSILPASVKSYRDDPETMAAMRTAGGKGERQKVDA